MADLEDTFGSDFAQEFQEKVKERRKEREKVSEQVMAEICHRAVSGDEFQGGDPMFSYETDKGVTHDVLLMTLPEIESDGKTIWNYMNELDSGAVSIPLDYMGEWLSCLFNDPDELKKMEVGQSYLVVGDLGTWETDEGEQRDQISPVRGVASLEEVKKYAKQAEGDGEADWNEGSDEEEDEEEFPEPESEPEPEEDMPSFASEGEEEEEEDDSEDDVFDEDTEEEEEEDESEPFTYDEVEEVVENLAEKEESVWEVDEGSDRHKKVAEVAAQRLDLLDADKETQKALLDEVWAVIDAHGEDEDDDQDEEEALFG